MSNSYSEALLHVQTEDGLALAGAAIRPSAPASPLAIVWIHGNTGTFHDEPYILAGREVARQGYTFIIGNTRGYGVTSEIWNVHTDQPVAGGSAWELLEEAPFDVQSWIKAAIDGGSEAVVLVGHSQGAAKVALYAAEREDKRVRGVALASPDLHGHWSELVAQAGQLVAEGRGAELLPPIMGAAWYRLSAANVASRARVLSTLYAAPSGEPRIAAITCPLLAFFGTNDIGGEGELQTIRANARLAAGVTTRLLSGADHVYTEHEVEAARLIVEWIRMSIG